MNWLEFDLELDGVVLKGFDQVGNARSSRVLSLHFLDWRMYQCIHVKGTICERGKRLFGGCLGGGIAADVRPEDDFVAVGKWTLS